MFWTVTIILWVLTIELFLWILRTDFEDSFAKGCLITIGKLVLVCIFLLLTLSSISELNKLEPNSPEASQVMLTGQMLALVYIALRWLLLKIVSVIKDSRRSEGLFQRALLIGITGIVIGLVWFSWNRFVKRWYMSIDPPAHLIFAGKVVNHETGEWPNNRIVLLFLGGNEIGRVVTKQGEFWGSNQGVHDGLFVIEVDNPYHLTETTLNENKDVALRWASKRSLLEGVSFGWIDLVEEGQLYKIPVSAKNITYVIKVVDGDVSRLPPQLLAKGSATLKKNNSIIVAMEKDNSSKIKTTSPNDIVYDIKYDIRTEELELDKLTVPINNCAGNAPISQKYIDSQTVIREYHLDVEVGVSVDIPINAWLSIIPQLQIRYGFEQGQLKTTSVERNMEAKPGTNVTYVITRKEIWKIGEASMVSANDIVTVPFKVRIDQIYQIDSKSSPCN